MTREGASMNKDRELIETNLTTNRDRESIKTNITNFGKVENEVDDTFEPDLMAPPDGSKFDTCEQLMEFVNKWSLKHGYAVSIHNSHPGKEVYLKCSQGGSNEDSHSKGQRTTASRRTKCPFMLYGRVLQRIKPLQWHLKVNCADHNHEASRDPRGHSIHRRIQPQHVETITSMFESGIPTRQILTSLNQESEKFLATSVDLYNFKRKLLREKFRGQTSMEFVLEKLSTLQSNWIHSTFVASDGSLEGLFFAHAGSV